MNYKMTDAELSKILERYQAAESIGIFLGALCVIAGCVLAFVLHELIMVLILGFGGVVLLLLIALPAQKKKNALIWQQLGGYFGAELKRFFGEEPEKPELPIDYRFLKRQGFPRGRAQRPAVLRRQCRAWPHGRGALRSR